MFCELCVWAEQVSVTCHDGHVSRVTCHVSRSTTCVVVYLMLKYDWNALQALTHIRGFRPVEVVLHTAGSGQREPPRLVLEVGGLQLCRQPCMELKS